MRNAMNEVTRAAYVRDCDIGVQRWNRLIEEAGHDFRLSSAEPALPALDRRLGRHRTPIRRARPITAEEWRARQRDWLPSSRGSRLCRQA